MDEESIRNIAINTHTDGFGLYVLTHFPPEDKFPMSEETLDEMWESYRREHEDSFTSIVSVDTELRNLNRSEEFFSDVPQLYHVLDYWKDKLLLQELPNNMLTPEALISWDAFETAVLDKFYDMLEAEFGDNKEWETYDSTIRDIEKDLDLMGALMHVVSPFIFLLLRFSFYQLWLQKTIESDDFRRNCATVDYTTNEKALRLKDLHDVNLTGYPAKRIYKRFAGLFSQAIKGYVASAPRAVSDDNIDVMTYIAMAQLEVTRLNQDEKVLREHCQPFFVDSLIEWHRGYFAYLIYQIHQFKGYENFQIPEYRVTEVKKKPKVIDENRALTSLGKSCRRAVVKYIQECRTSADFGRLLYEFQFEKKYFTPNLMSRNDYYLFMQQIGHVTFGYNGDDFSNCNKGFYQASKEAAQRKRLQSRLYSDE